VADPRAVFERDGDRADVVVPSELARGPWSPHAQHGGAPTALLAGVLERFDPGPATFPARLTVELLRPVPIAPLRIAASTIRPGKKVQLLQGSLFSGDSEVVRATLLRLQERPTEYAAEPVSRAPRPLPTPHTQPPTALRAGSGDVGFWSAVEMRRGHGDWSEPGPGGLWVRLVVPVVAGEEPSPLQRVAAAADFGNGISAGLERGRYSYINPDLTITLHRLPVGEWVGLDAVTYAEPTGFGVAESVLHDERGRIGRAVQTVLIEALAEPGGGPLPAS